MKQDLTSNKRVLMTAGSLIDYDALTQDALRGVVRNVLVQVAKSGLPGDHHFYVAFNTQAPGVVMSRRLKEKYPDEMMIVLQHRFWDLAVTDEGFEVKLTFDGIPERLYVPFPALRVFYDPSVRFTLQFGDMNAGDDAADGGGSRRRKDGADNSPRGGDRRNRGRPRARADNGQDASEPHHQPSAAPAPVPTPVATPPTVLSPRPVAVPTAQPQDEGAPSPQVGGAKVFSLDQFRKK